MFCKFRIGPTEPFPELSIFAILDWWKINNNDKHCETSLDIGKRHF
jgi:hypothetical protein